MYISCRASCESAAALCVCMCDTIRSALTAQNIYDIYTYICIYISYRASCESAAALSSARSPGTRVQSDQCSWRKRARALAPAVRCTLSPGPPSQQHRRYRSWESCRSAAAVRCAVSAESGTQSARSSRYGCMHVCMHVYLCVSVCVCVCMYACVNVYVRFLLHILLKIYICIHMHIYVLCVCVCVY
jgi:hypothetical protein